MKRRLRTGLSLVVLCLVLASRLLAQAERGSISGRVTDSAGGVLQGAIVTVTPGGANVVTDQKGDYVLAGLTPGEYTVNVNYVGFGAFTKEVRVTTGRTTVDAALQVAGQSEQILVTADRPRGEAAQINRERTADNIVQVLSAEVITSLPNANIADALGRLPSVTLERDEGEGKYVQIRGTEPRLSNLTIDGVNVPSPEGGVRQIKLDTLASDLVESVEINKTLQANMDGDGIGGSVNLRTKTAAEQPTVMFNGVGGFTPIIGGRGVDQFGATLGQRFGPDKRLGLLVGGTYDWNGRGINDIEPSPTVTSLTPHYDSIDLRDYMYYRTRWGLTGSSDYRLSNGSSLFVARLLLDISKLGSEVGVHAERWRCTESEYRLATARLRRGKPRRRRSYRQRHELAELGRVGVALSHAAVRRQWRRKLQVERGESELRRQLGREHEPERAGVQRVVFRGGCDEHRGHRELHVVQVDARVGRPVGAAEPAGLGGVRADLPRRATVRHDRVRRQDPQRAQVRRLVHHQLHGEEGRDHSRWSVCGELHRFELLRPELSVALTECRLRPGAELRPRESQSVHTRRRSRTERRELRSDRACGCRICHEQHGPVDAAATRSGCAVRGDAREYAQLQQQHESGGLQRGRRLRGPAAQRVVARRGVGEHQRARWRSAARCRGQIRRTSLRPSGRSTTRRCRSASASAIRP